MLSDAGGLGMSLAAITLATGGAAAAHRTYGWYRLEILASLVNTVLLFGLRPTSSMRRSSGWAATTRSPPRR